MICAFVGHHDCPTSIRQNLLEIIKTQIENGTSKFYVGNHGTFDALVLSCLRELKQTHKEIDYAVVLAYLPLSDDIYLSNETILPEGIEAVPKRYAIAFRNLWMINHAETIITYVVYSWSNTAKYIKKAKNKDIKIINIYDK